MRLRIGHSPDPDDAFMAWALAEGAVKDPAFEVEIVPRDIETLNQWALDGRGLDVTALSVAAFAQVTDEYLLVPFGASFGEGYGPVVVAAQDLDPSDLRALHVAGPGPFTTATSALRMAVGHLPNLEHIRFTDILPGVKHGLYDAGLLIHEGQITYEREGLVKVLDLGEWWAREEHGLPLPLGVVAVRRDVGEDLLPRAVALVKRAIDAAMENRETAIAYASKFARGLPMEDVSRFVDMYVTPLTLDMRPRGQQAVKRFIMRMLDAGLIEPGARFEFAPDPQMPNPRTLALFEEQVAPPPVTQADEPPVAAAMGVEAPAAASRAPARRALPTKRAAKAAKVARKPARATANPGKSVAKKATKRGAPGKAAKPAKANPGKRAAAKKPAAKKAAPKKAAAKKTVAKKPSAKKPAKKAAPKKASKKTPKGARGRRS